MNEIPSRRKRCMRSLQTDSTPLVVSHESLSAAADVALHSTHRNTRSGKLSANSSRESSLRRRARTAGNLARAPHGTAARPRHATWSPASGTRHPARGGCGGGGGEGLLRLSRTRLSLRGNFDEWHFRNISVWERSGCAPRGSARAALR